VADVLRELTRATDVPARLAGDEFAVLVERPVGSEPLDALALRISTEVARRAADAGLDVGASIGAATSARHRHRDELLRLADAAMYAQKLARRERRRPGALADRLRVACGSRTPARPPARRERGAGVTRAKSRGRGARGDRRTFVAVVTGGRQASQRRRASAGDSSPAPQWRPDLTDRAV
jgi:hypothetical protein